MRCAAKNVDNRVRGITPVMITGSEQARLRLASLVQAEFNRQTHDSLKTLNCHLQFCAKPERRDLQFAGCTGGEQANRTYILCIRCQTVGRRMRSHESVRRMHRCSGKEISRRGDAAIPQWTHGCRGEHADRQRLHRADHRKFLFGRRHKKLSEFACHRMPASLHLPLWKSSHAPVFMKLPDLSRGEFSLESKRDA